MGELSRVHCDDFWDYWPPDPSHKSHNAPITNPTMHHIVTEICTCLHLSVTKCCSMGYLSDALWDFWDGSGGQYLKDHHNRHAIARPLGITWRRLYMGSLQGHFLQSAILILKTVLLHILLWDLFDNSALNLDDSVASNKRKPLSLGRVNSGVLPETRNCHHGPQMQGQDNCVHDVIQ